MGAGLDTGTPRILFKFKKSRDRNDCSSLSPIGIERNDLTFGLMPFQYFDLFGSLFVLVFLGITIAPRPLFCACFKKTITPLHFPLSAFLYKRAEFVAMLSSFDS